MSNYNTQVVQEALVSAGLPIKMVSVSTRDDDTDGDPVTVFPGQGRIVWSQEPTAQQVSDAQAIVAAHDPTDYATAQRDTTTAQAKELFGDLRALPPREASYVGLARLLAVRKGLTIAQAKAVIFDEASATSAVIGATEWQNLPGTVKPFMGLLMGAVADSMAVMLLLLGD